MGSQDISVTTPYGSDSLSGFTYNAVTQQPLLIYPNPAKGYITIRHQATSGSSQIQLIDMQGSVIRTFILGLNTTQTKVDLTGLKPGIYRIIWYNGTKTHNQIVFVQ
jgi:hypothetical protein